MVSVFAKTKQGFLMITFNRTRKAGPPFILAGQLLMPDAAYFQQCPDNDATKVFIHHLPGPLSFFDGEMAVK